MVKIVEMSKEVQKNTEGYRFITLGMVEHYKWVKMLWRCKNV